MRVGVIGTGHVGLPTAASLAHFGHDVMATDVESAKLALLSAGEVPFYEPGLADLIEAGMAAGRLAFTAQTAEVIRGSRVVFICVGTPPRLNGDANLLAVERAAESVARYADGNIVVVEKSTVPAGTAERIEQTLARHNPAVRFSVVSNPEFLREGSAVEDSLNPSRVLVGSDAPEGLAVMRELYAPLLEAGVRFIEADVRTAELAKHACNAFLATKISFANALARLCELAGADVVSVAKTMGSDPRIGPSYLDAGLGYGGYCFPKDLAAFRALATRLGYDFRLLDEVARINDDAVEWAFRKVEEALWNLEEKRIAVLGLAFKPGTDDVRLAPPLALARRLIAAGASVIGYDPQAACNAAAEVSGLQVTEDLYSALHGAHCAVICTEWRSLKVMDLNRARDEMSLPIIVDGRNALHPPAAAAAGFTYIPTGRPHPQLATTPQ